MFVPLKNGINLNIIIKGNMSGYPLIFLHGNTESLEIYDSYENDLQDYKLIFVDSRCHGKSSFGELSYELMADDILLLIEELKINRFSLIGFSDGGIIGLILGMKLKTIDKMFLIGPNINPSGQTDECINWLKEHESIYSNLCLTEPNIKPVDLLRINSRTIIIGGEFDLIKKEHLELINNSIKNSYLYIINGADHFIPMNNKDELIKIIKNEMSLDIFYEDNHVLIVYKESGILSQEDDTKEKDILNISKQYLKTKYNKPGDVYLGLISRLDRNVSGLMVLSKTTKATQRLNENRPKKTYTAVVYGKTKEEDTLVDYISKNEKTKTAYLDKLGKESILHYKRLDYKDDLSLLEVKIDTGRFHQIRFQLSNIGHSIYNDYKYNNSIIQNGYEIGLDASKVEFIHPITKEIITIERIPYRDIFNKFI